MYLTKRDKDIIHFLQDNESMTIKQCGLMFYKGNKEVYYQARKRLHTLYKGGYIRRYREDMRSEVIYYYKKVLSKHDLLLLDVYSKLVNIGANIKLFEKEYRVKTRKKTYKIDGLIELNYKGYWYPVIIEVDHTHYTSKYKLDNIFNSGHFQERYKALGEDIFPTVIVIKDSKPTVIDDDYKVIYDDYILDTFINNLF